MPQKCMRFFAIQAMKKNHEQLYIEMYTKKNFFMKWQFVIKLRSVQNGLYKFIKHHFADEKFHLNNY